MVLFFYSLAGHCQQSFMPCHKFQQKKILFKSETLSTCNHWLAWENYTYHHASGACWNTTSIWICNLWKDSSLLRILWFIEFTIIQTLTVIMCLGLEDHKTPEKTYSTFSYYIPLQVYFPSVFSLFLVI